MRLSAIPIRLAIPALMFLTSAVCLSQQKAPGESDKASFQDRGLTISGLDFSLRVLNDGGNKVPPSYSLLHIISALLSERPNLAEEAFVRQISGFDKKVKYVSNSGPREENPRGSTQVITMVGLGRTTSTDGDTYRFQLRLYPPLRVPSGEALEGIKRTIAGSIVKELPDFSREFQKNHFQAQIVAAQKELAALTSEAAEADAWVHREDPMPIEKTAEQLAETSRQLISTQLALAGMKAREQAIREAILATSQKMDAASDDRTVKNLEQLHKLRADRLERLKQLTATGAASQDDVQKAEADVLAAEIDTDKTRSAVKRAAGGERLEALNNELSRLAIDRAENEARLDFLRKMMDETSAQLRERREIQHRVDEAKPKLERLRAQIESLNIQLAQLKDAAEHVQPLRVELPDPETAEAR
jgi:hypothetical protein